MYGFVRVHSCVCVCVCVCVHVVVVYTLCIAALNALCSPLMTELAKQLDAYEADPKIGAIVITGSGKAFAAGADIKEMAPKSFPATYTVNACIITMLIVLLFTV